MVNITNVKLKRRRRRKIDRLSIKILSYIVALLAMNYKKDILCKKETRRTQEGFRVYSIKMYENIALSVLYYHLFCFKD